MSQRKAPYLRVIRDPGSVEPSQAAQEAEPLAEAIEPPAVVDSQPAPSGGADTTEKETENAVSAAAAPAIALNQPLTQAIMYAAVGWVALCVERAVYAVDITPIGRRTYEVSARYADASGTADGGEGILLRVTLEVESGLVVRSTVEPIRP